jgi:hypothetical protein
LCIEEEKFMPEVGQIVHCRTKKPLEVNGSVAVVGNSDQLTSADYGHEIDAHDNVFRFNLASLEEKFKIAIGTKADFFFLSRDITTLRYPHPEKLQNRFRYICRTSKIICYPGHTKNVIKYCKRPYLMVNDIPSINAVIKELFARPPVVFPQINHPRNGVKLTIALIDAGIVPTLYGFDLDQRESSSHYFDEESQVDVGKGNPGHRLDLEYTLLQECAEKGLIEVKG